MLCQFRRSEYLYFLLILLRFLMTFWPQSGYIHDDEFFQTPEIVYGKMLSLKCPHTWDPKTQIPVRNVAFPYVANGFPALLMKLLGIDAHLSMESYSYLLLVLPRFIMCCLSFINDICIYKLMKLVKKNPLPPLILFASSYTTLVYLTRTFTNTLDTLFYTLLIYRIFHQYHGWRRSPKKSIAKKQYRDKICYILGTFLTVIIYLRPIFLIFFITPACLFLLFSQNRKNNIFSIIRFTTAAFSTSLFIAFVDIAYKRITEFESFNNIQSVWENILLTPFNFIKYNSSNQLSLHECHPRYMHFLYNIPLMFSVLGIHGMIQVVCFFVSIIRRKVVLSWRESFFIWSFFVPLCLLSPIPYQEPHFLLPILFPMVCLCGEYLYNHYKVHTFMLLVWITANISGLVFFGFLNEAGTIPALTYLNKMSVGNSDFVFFHTYMPPRHLLGLGKLQKGITVHNLPRANETMLQLTIENILSSNYSEKVYVMTPSTLTSPINHVNSTLKPPYELKLEQQFFPHLSLEVPPDMPKLWNVVIGNMSYCSKTIKIKNFLSLNVYVIESISIT